MSANFHIRPYHPSDVNTVIALFQRSIHDLGAEYYSKAQLAAWAPEEIDLEAWQQKLSTAHTLIAEADRHVLGFISFYTEEKDSGYMIYFTAALAIFGMALPAPSISRQKQYSAAKV